MKKVVSFLIVVMIFNMFLAGCSSTVASSAPTRTPTTEKPKPTATPTITPATRNSTPTLTVTPAPPALPPIFDITLALTNLTCGSGGTTEHPYTFTIDETSLSLLQVDAGVTTTGTYEPASGAFATSAVVGPGTESYSGTIAFDGATITVTGGNSYEQSGQCTFTASLTGTTTVP
ncbi:MAG: hypothetical protein HZB18_07010 [Chloroflexi bacterium]|nr:hypothetical protein [Chloroflexota bacterium]